MQHKYFFRIRQLTKYESITKQKSSQSTSNCVTNTYIRFLYKKYRFCFGFFESCDFSSDEHNQTTCSNPSSIILSKSRKACCQHKYHLFKQPSEHTFINSFIRINNKWRSKEYKFIRPSRKGIRYNTQIISAPKRDIPNKGFYAKSFSNYYIEVSCYTPRTRKK